MTSRAAGVVLLLCTTVTATVPEHILPIWTARPQSIPSNGCVDAPVFGNGAVGAGLSSNGSGDLRFYFDRNDAWVPATGDITACGYDMDNAGKRTLGMIQLSFNGTTSFRASQLISNGTVTSTHGVSTGGELHSSSYVARGTDVLITRLWWVGDPTAVLNVSVRTTQNDQANQQDYCHTFNSGENSSVAFASRQLGKPYQNVKSQIGRRHFYKAAWASATTQGSPTELLLRGDGTPATIVTAVLSNFDDSETYPDPELPAQELALKALTQTDSLRAAHLSWWAAFWNISSVSLPSAPLLETQWFGSLYILASSHRTDGSTSAVAPGIVWPVTSDRPAFRGTMTMNYNQEALYYGVAAAGHPELGGPFYNAMLQYIPRGRKDATSQFECRGINMDCEIFHWGQSASGVGDQGQRSNAALAAVPFATHWLWTRDVQWLESTGWPYLNEVALFWEDYLVKYGLNYPGTPNGSFSSVNDCFNELCESNSEIVNVNPHISISLLRYLLPVFIDAAQALNIEPDRQVLWAHLHQNLAPLPLTVVNQTDNRTVFAGVLGGSNYPSPGSNPLNTYLGWPGFDDALSTDQQLRTVLKNTLDVMQSWTCGNCWPQYPAARVRMQDKDTQANSTWHTVQDTLSKLIAPNLIVQDGPGNMNTAMEGAGGIGIVNEMLMQSQDPRGIVLFPQVPLGQPAGFNKLRARGGYLVSASLSAAGLVDAVVLVNDARDGAGSNVSLKSPWWPQEQQVQVTEATKGKRAVQMQDGWATFSSVPGETLNIRSLTRA